MWARPEVVFVSFLAIVMIWIQLQPDMCLRLSWPFFWPRPHLHTSQVTLSILTFSGMHAKSNTCNHLEVEIAQFTGKLSSTDLFPTSLVVKSAHRRGYLGRPNGGWGDPRDQALCCSFTQSRWFPVADLPSRRNRAVEAFEPLIRGVSNVARSVLWRVLNY